MKDQIAAEAANEIYTKQVLVGDAKRIIQAAIEKALSGQRIYGEWGTAVVIDDEFSSVKGRAARASEKGFKCATFDKSETMSTIAAELANDLFGTDCAPSELRKIQAAIEKATQKHKDLIERLCHELGKVADSRSRAAHASEPTPEQKQREYDEFARKQQTPAHASEQGAREWTIEGQRDTATATVSRAAHASEPLRLLNYWYRERGSIAKEAYDEIKHALESNATLQPARASEKTK